MPLNGRAVLVDQVDRPHRHAAAQPLHSGGIAGFEMALRNRGAVYEISNGTPVRASRGVIGTTLDGAQQPVSQGKARLKPGEGDGVLTIAITLG